MEKQLNVLMIGDIANVGSNLKKGLEQKGHTVVLVKNNRPTQDVDGDYNLSWKGLVKSPVDHSGFDIAHVHSPNLKKLGLLLGFRGPVIMHWHGSDLRHPLKAFPFYHYALNHGSYHLYSTIDLAWWLRDIPDDKKVLFRCPVDTEMFQPKGEKHKGSMLFKDGARGFIFHHINHRDMPKTLNRFESIDVRHYDGLDDRLVSVTALEAAACGCRVNQLPWLNREWVLQHASIDSQIKQLLNIYNQLLKNGDC